METMAYEVFLFAPLMDVRDEYNDKRFGDQLFTEV